MSGRTRVIRAERRGPAVIRAELHDAQLAAAEIRRAAAAEAAQLRAAARLELEQTRQRVAEERERAREACEAELASERAAAHQRGYVDGYAEGSARAARELTSIAAARASALREGQKLLQRAAMQLARKLVGKAADVDPAYVAALVEPLLACVRRAQRVILCLHPEDAAALEPRLLELRARAEFEGVLEIVRDDSVARGGCTIESELGELDARVSTRLGEIARALGWESP
jgi:flagellar biosynthesis/type III secretory pathway protein FliH